MLLNLLYINLTINRIQENSVAFFRPELKKKKRQKKEKM